MTVGGGGCFDCFAGGRDSYNGGTNTLRLCTIIDKSDFALDSLATDMQCSTVQRDFPCALVTNVEGNKNYDSTV